MLDIVSLHCAHRQYRQRRTLGFNKIIDWYVTRSHLVFQYYYVKLIVSTAKNPRKEKEDAMEGVCDGDL